jgi:hypothetical protein
MSCPAPDHHPREAIFTAVTPIPAGVAFLSLAEVYAVCYVHCVQKAWARTPFSAPANSQLSGITATSASNAWAVGDYTTGTLSIQKTLILHWNGKTWRQVPSPSPAKFKNGGATLTAVAAASPASTWAVGAYLAPRCGFVGGLILHWNGKSWQNDSANAAARPPLTTSAASPRPRPPTPG